MSTDIQSNDVPTGLLDPTPSPVPHLDAVSLEWPQLLALITTYASSQVGRDGILTLLPSTDPAWIAHQHQLVHELRTLLDSGITLSLGSLFDPTELADKSQIPGAALELEEFQSIARLAHAIASWQSIIQNGAPQVSGQSEIRVPPVSILRPGRDASETTKSPVSGLLDLSLPLHQSLKPLAESIQRKFLPDGTLADDASPELARIRHAQQRQQQAIAASLRAALRRLSSDGQTQDELITIRGDRFVIPVKAEQKRRVSGVVHGASSSGQTVYVEPLETIEENNELVRLLEEEQAEIHRIFVALTRLVATHAPQLIAGARILAVLDTLQARARFAREFNCTQPTFPDQAKQANADSNQNIANQGGEATAEGAGGFSPRKTSPRAEGALAPGLPQPTLKLESARHPLLEKRLKASSGEIIPFTIELGHPARQLIISGPNAGGKTVTLKTAALCAVMAQAGIPVPAASATQPIFTAFLADIGDAQSIEQALSTFSAHIVNLNRISHLVTPSSLILLDELGSSTDPDEGSALAVAVADFFRTAGAWSLISTHHTSLKVYAANTPGVLNAAAGVDPDTLAPTYHLQLGIPGASAGIATAARLGLNTAIITEARQRLSTQQADIGRFLANLHNQLTELESERKAARAEQYALNQERARLTREGDIETKRRTKELEQKLGSLLKDFEFQMRQTVSAIEDKGAQLKLSKESERRIARLRRDFEEQFNSTVVAHRSGAGSGAPTDRSSSVGWKDDPNAQPHLVRNIAVGDQVRIKSMNRIGNITRELEKDLFEVALGTLKMRVRRDDIAAVSPTDKPATKETPLAAVAKQKGVRVSITSSASDNMKTEINLIGHTVDEATNELEKYLDQAFLAGLPRVRVIHGTGMGILRRALRDYLRTHPHVAGITEPSQLEGGAGATVVDLRQ
ncbi:endonuclease MutS2 [Acidicapsa dinghuensis]|uniref:Endonuclease MutS2 n=1 Tax=Acidicapsa dinghuensis TaxID=2218256 RepID=A0ABW1EA29_9BACT|nr:Smr/MutS family protein [Acidicapsa dinghuensis]